MNLNFQHGRIRDGERSEGDSDVCVSLRAIGFASAARRLHHRDMQGLVAAPLRTYGVVQRASRYPDRAATGLRPVQLDDGRTRLQATSGRRGYAATDGVFTDR